MKNLDGSRRARRGFTLMELLVVVSIMVILAGLSMGVMSYVNQKQAYELAKVQLGQLELAIEEFKAENGRYPMKDSRGRDSSEAFRGGENSTTILQYELCPPENARDDEGRKRKVYVPSLDPDNDTQGWLKGTRAGSIQILDPWGSPYRYRTNSPKSKSAWAANPGFDLWSAGPDGKTKFRRGEYEFDDRENIDDVRLW